MYSVLAGRDVPPRQLLYREFAGYGGQQAIWSGRWKGVRQGLSRGPADLELYDLDADPTESRNVAEEQPDVVARLEAAMAKEQQDANLRYIIDMLTNLDEYTLQLQVT